LEPISETNQQERLVIEDGAPAAAAEGITIADIRASAVVADQALGLQRFQPLARGIGAFVYRRWEVVEQEHGPVVGTQPLGAGLDAGAPPGEGKVLGTLGDVPELAHRDGPPTAALEGWAQQLFAAAGTPSLRQGSLPTQHGNAPPPRLGV